ncbi:MAG: hypothetical protein QXR26_07930 [Candidatus Caldarchaeum sp.]
MAVARLFGASIKRREDPRLLTGRGRFTANLKLPGMVYAYFIRSPYAHAKVKNIDVSKARSVRGVLDVVIGGDIKYYVGPVPCAWQIPGSNLKIPRYMPLAVDKVRFVGDPVAVVVAESYEAALDAAELVNVGYEVLPCVVNAEEAVN